MAYSISYSFVSSRGEACPELYIRALATNPTTIEENSSVDLNFVADGTFYLLPAKLKFKVVGATRGNLVRNDEYTEGTLTISNPTSDVTITVTADPRMTALVNGPFISENQTPIDPRFVLSKEQMPLVDDATQPDRYMCVCCEDSRMYIYKKEAEFDPELGKFRPLEVYMDFTGSEEAQQSFDKALDNAHIIMDGGDLDELVGGAD